VGSLSLKLTESLRPFLQHPIVLGAPLGPFVSCFGEGDISNHNLFSDLKMAALSGSSAYDSEQVSMSLGASILAAVAEIPLIVILYAYFRYLDKQREKNRL